MEGLRGTKIVKQIKFEGVWGELEGKYCFQRQSWPKYMRQTFSVSVKEHDTGKVQFQFLNSFLLVLTKCSFWEEDWTLDYNSMKIWDLLNIS